VASRPAEASAGAAADHHDRRVHQVLAWSRPALRLRASTMRSSLQVSVPAQPRLGAGDDGAGDVVG
jgi:hypothetical protein